ncbi:MAG: metallopeptidase family protein [Alphaproteobacteria bacterium]
MFYSEPRTNEDFEQVAQRVWDGLPEPFRQAVGNLSIQVVDFADMGTLSKLGIDDAYGLLGLYHGVGLPHKSVWDLPRGPDMIFLYRAPILSYAHQRREPVEAVIRHVLIHEVGHHFGFSDDDMEAIETKT